MFLFLFILLTRLFRFCGKNSSFDWKAGSIPRNLLLGSSWQMAAKKALYRERARDWRGASDPEGLERSLRRQAQRMERSGTPESPVSGAGRRKCAQIFKKKLEIYNNNGYYY
jgi:hypothetical protein